MDTKLLCIVQGIIGIIFGSLALFLPDITLGTFIALFWVLLGAGIILSLLLATTSSDKETMFWFGVSALLLAIGVGSVFIQGVVAIIFVLIIAGVVFYSGFYAITLALAQPKTKYIVIFGMFVTDAILLCVLLWYFPALSKNLILVVLGTSSLVFGIFSVLMGWYLPNEAVMAAVAALPVKKGERSGKKPGEK
jgi:uncharacterized membrane protein HdeD (DUF308 family)